MKKWLCRTLSGVAVVTGAVSVGLYRYAVPRKQYLLPLWHKIFPHKEDAQHLACKPRYEAGLKWAESESWEKRSITSYDGLKLSGRYLENPHSRKTIILCHGFRSNHIWDFAGILPYLYDELGLSILMISQRSHGDSQGSHICYGTKERFDVCRWAKLIADEKPSEEIFLYGISMGSATVMMSASTDLPKNVKGLICDCGYTSPKEIFASVIRKGFHLPTFPCLYIAGIFAKIFAGFGFSDCSAKESLAGTDIPVLLIHGTADDFVPSYMSDENFAACKSEKYLLKIEGAEHAISYYVDFEKYTGAVKKFIQNH